MKNTGLIKEIKKNKITVSIFKDSACSHCSKCNENSKIANEIILNYNINNLSIGDTIIFEMKSKQIFKAALIVYILPVFFIIGGYYIGTYLNFSEAKSICFSFLALLFSFLLIYFYDRFIVKNRLESSINIIEIKKQNEEPLC